MIRDLTDKQLALRIFATGLVLLAGSSGLISCGVTEWQKGQDSMVLAHKHLHSAEMQAEIDKARR